MTSDVPLPDRFTKIDELTRPDHSWLSDGDRCYFLGEYTARQGYAYSPTNDLILNFKKPLDRRQRPEWRYKEMAIQQAAAAFQRAIGPEPLSAVFAPIPPSMAHHDPHYDDRLTRMLRAIWPDQTVDIRELIIQTERTKPAHERLDRPAPTEIHARYRINESLSTPTPAHIAIVDDVLTTGAHFRAACAVLTARFPAARMVGLFIARRVPDADPEF